MKKPSFLALDWNIFLPLLEQNKVQQAPWQVDEKLFLPSTVVVANGSVVFNGSKAKITNGINHDYAQSQSEHDFVQANKNNLDFMLTIEATQPNEKINVVHLMSGSHVHATKIVVASKKALQVDEQILSMENANFNQVTQFFVQEDAQLTYVCLQQAKGNGFFGHEAWLEKNAHFTSHIIGLNQGTTLATSTTHLMGEGAEANVNQLVFASGKDHVATLVRAKHEQKNTQSNLNNLALLAGESYVHIDGINHIEKGNSKSQASQHTRMINLSPLAKSVANPQLMIDEFDVKAGHAATVGKLDEEQIYYLQSRGLTREQSMHLLVEAAVEEFLQGQSNEFAEKIKQQFMKKI